MEQLKHLIKNSELQKTLIVTLGVFFGSIFAFLLQIMLGRFLNVSEYGTFTALLSTFALISVAISSSITALIKIVSGLRAEGKFDTLTLLYRKLLLIELVIGIIFAVLGFLLKNQVSRFLNITNVSIIVWFGVYVGSTFLSIAPAAYLQGLLRFKAFSFWNILSNAVRFAFALAPVVLGLGLFGLFQGLIFAVFVSFVIGTILLWKNFTDYTQHDLSQTQSEFFNLIWAAVLVNIGMTIFNNVDVILVKHYFDANSAGLYSGVVTIGKVFLFGTSTVGIVMYPQIAALFTKKEQFLGKFKVFLFLQSLMIVGGLIIFVGFPEVITKIMFGYHFLPSAPYLAKYSLFVAACVFLNFMMLFFLAIEKKKILFFQFPAIVLQFLLLLKFHRSIDQIINVNLFVAVVLFISVMVYYFRYAGFHNNADLQA
jgi:O-antigen/teichoic acid export membrane protein